jgi:hypothetical protein
MRKLAFTVIFAAWLLCFSSMFMPALTGDPSVVLSGAVMTQLSLICLLQLPASISSVFERGAWFLEFSDDQKIFYGGLIGFCNMLFVLSFVVIWDKRKVFLEWYPYVLLGACMIVTSYFFFHESLFPMANKEIAIGAIIWSSAFFVLTVGIYLLKQSTKVKKATSN